MSLSVGQLGWQMGFFVTDWLMAEDLQYGFGQVWSPVAQKDAT